MSTNNRFLQSSLTTNDLATETTLKKVSESMTDGTMVVGADLTSLGGTAIDTGSGVGGAGTQRVAVACHTNVFQARGSSVLLSAAVSTLGYDSAPNPVLMATDTAIQLSSSAIGDTGVVVVTGYNQAWDAVAETYTLNGQAPVTKATLFFRINRLQYVDTTPNAGVVYASVAGSLITVGKPAPASYLFSMEVAYNVSQLALMTVPAQADSLLVLKRFQATYVNNADDYGAVVLQVKRTGSSIWNSELTVYTKTLSQAQIDYDLTGYVPIANGNSWGHDFRIVAAHAGAGECRCSGSVIVEIC